MTEAPLVAENVGHRYGRHKPWALRNVSLSVPAESITALVGPNGAGKSTLIRSWMGFEHPNEGRLFVDGIDVGRDRVAAVKRTGYVPQSASLYPGLSVDEHFVLAASYRQDFDRPYARARLSSIGVAVDRKVGTLSGGEQAQVSLALALGTRAPVLLLDEPLANLDPLARREFFATLVESVRSTGATVVLSSHIVTDIEESCDSLVVLARGQIVLQARVEDALREHQTLGQQHLDEARAVGKFLGPRGEKLALVRGVDTGGRGATLEEIVLGYIASSRTDVSAEEA